MGKSMRAGRGRVRAVLTVDGCGGGFVKYGKVRRVLTPTTGHTGPVEEEDARRRAREMRKGVLNDFLYGGEREAEGRRDK
jgi:hypothetical protein